MYTIIITECNVMYYRRQCIPFALWFEADSQLSHSNCLWRRKDQRHRRRMCSWCSSLMTGREWSSQRNIVPRIEVAEKGACGAESLTQFLTRRLSLFLRWPLPTRPLTESFHRSQSLSIESAIIIINNNDINWLTITVIWYRNLLTKKSNRCIIIIITIAGTMRGVVAHW